MEQYVAIGTYSNDMDAELAQAALGAAGIVSYLKYEDTGGMMPVLRQSEGVKLLVDEKDELEAKAILSEQARTEYDEDIPS